MEFGLQQLRFVFISMHSEESVFSLGNGGSARGKSWVETFVRVG